MPGFEGYEWNGVFVPTGTSPDIIQKLNAGLNEVLRQPDIQARFKQLNVDYRENTPDEFRDFVAAETEKWGKVVRDAGIKLGRAGATARSLRTRHRRPCCVPRNFASVREIARERRGIDLVRIEIRIVPVEHALVVQVLGIGARAAGKSRSLPARRCRPAGSGPRPRPAADRSRPARPARHASIVSVCCQSSPNT